MGIITYSKALRILRTCLSLYVTSFDGDAWETFRNMRYAPKKGNALTFLETLFGLKKHQYALTTRHWRNENDFTGKDFTLSLSATYTTTFIPDQLGKFQKEVSLCSSDTRRETLERNKQSTGKNILTSTKIAYFLQFLHQ